VLVAASSALYSATLLSLLSPQMQSDLGLTAADLPGALAITRLGSLLALFMMLAADLLGRRQVLIAALLGLAFGNLATAASRSGAMMIAAQFFTMGCRACVEMLCVVVLVEELPAARRGYGTSLLQTLSFVGGAAGIVGLALVEWLPGGWRALFALGVLPALLVPWLAKHVRETERFSNQSASSPAAAAHLWYEAARDLWYLHPQRLVALLAVVMPCSAGLVASNAVLPQFLQQERGYSPAAVAGLYGMSGSLVPIATLAGGRLSDRFGRRSLIAGGALAGTAGGLLCFLAPGFWLTLGLGVFTSALVVVSNLLQTVGTELFPTSLRASATGIREAASILFVSLGLFGLSTLLERSGSVATAASLVLLGVPLAAVAVFALPETARRELEEIR
jgi:MFS family permease